MDEIAKKRAEKKEDSREWSTVDCLEDFLNEINRGNINPDQVIIHFTQPKENGGKSHGFACAGVTYTSHITLLNIALRRLIDEFLE